MGERKDLVGRQSLLNYIHVEDHEYKEDDANNTMLMLHSSVFEVKFQVAPILPIPGLTLMGLPNGDLGRCPFCALSDSWALFPSSKSIHLFITMAPFSKTHFTSTTLLR